MPYEIAAELFTTKESIKSRCREILEETPDGDIVADEHLQFLFELLMFHDEWRDKTSTGVTAITTQTTEQRTRCFVLLSQSGHGIDISFPHAIKLIPSSRSSNLTPQKLLDYRAAARVSVEGQISNFRAEALSTKPVCVITNDRLHGGNSAVDHIYPETFDRLLFDFSQTHGINPLSVVVDSVNGTVATFNDVQINRAWQQYHKLNCELRLISRIANLQLPKAKVDWVSIISSEAGGYKQES